MHYVNALYVSSFWAPDPHRGSAHGPRWGRGASVPSPLFCPPPLSKFLATPLIRVLDYEAVRCTKIIHIYRAPTANDPENCVEIYVYTLGRPCNQVGYSTCLDTDRTEI